MAKKKNFKNSGVKYKKMSRKNDYPGQTCLDLENSTEDEIATYEERDLRFEPSYAYWKAFEDFLNKSGKFAQTWHLYIGIKTDPDLKELLEKEARLKEKGLEPDEELKEQITGVKYRIHLMTVMHECETLDLLYNKAQREWYEYKYSLHVLLWKAKNAGVDPKISSSYEKTFMSCFVVEGYNGPCRREFYRKKYVRKYLDMEKNYPGPVPVINIRFIEKAFAEDDKFKEAFDKKRQKAKEKDREKREERMNGPRWKSKTKDKPPNH